MQLTTFSQPFHRLLSVSLVILGCLIGPVAQAQLVAAVLPSSRSAEVGNTVTAFATVINSGTDATTGCGIDGPAGLTGSFSFQTTDPATNAPTGEPNALVDLAPGASQSFVLSITPMAAIDSLDAAFSFSCTSGAAAASISGINTLLLSASNTPVADIIALAATAKNTGVLDIDESTGAFSLATINLGAQDTVTVTADTGDVGLPLALSLCETNPDTGQCLSTPAASIQVDIGAGAAPTFSVFSSTAERIANDPALNRIFVRFVDSSGVIRGATSVGIENEFDIAPNLTDSAFTALSTTFSNIDVTGSDVIDATVPCTTGQIIATGTIETDGNNSTSTLSTTFEDCDGVNGQLDSTTTIEFDTTMLSLNQIQNGSYSTPECTAVDIVDLQLIGTVDLSSASSEEPEIGVFSMSGTISGICEGMAFSCDLNEVALDDETRIEESCAL